MLPCQSMILRSRHPVPKITPKQKDGRDDVSKESHRALVISSESTPIVTV